MQIIVGVLFIFVFVILHEIAHGLVALWFGDDTAKKAGRLTLNPVAHVDLLGTILLPTLLVSLGAPLFGWAKPVPVNFYALRPQKLGIFCVAMAGIFVNLVMAIGAALVARFGVEPNGLAWQVLAAVVIVNLLLAVFNLIPIPPLDGHYLIAMFLPDKWRVALQMNMVWFFLFLIMIAPMLPIGPVVYGIAEFMLGVKFEY